MTAREVTADPATCLQEGRASVSVGHAQVKAGPRDKDNWGKRLKEVPHEPYLLYSPSGLIAAQRISEPLSALPRRS